MDRSEIQRQYVDCIVDGMDLDDCLALLKDCLSADLDEYSDKELIEEVDQYYPHLIEEESEENSEEPSEATGWQ